MIASKLSLSPGLSFTNSPVLAFTSSLLIILMGILLIYMLFVLFLKSRQNVLNKKWLAIINILIQNAIFNEDPNQKMLLPSRVRKLLEDKKFRRLLISELTNAKKSFSGIAASNLEQLYVQCGLEDDSLEKLRSTYWHIKAQGIQELALMGRKEAFNDIYRLTNNVNEQVRMEAQNAVVEFSGLEGLKFLDFLTHPMSDWQQINLLTKLGDPTAQSSSYIGHWLSSENTSVVIFSLKLAAIFHHFELHEKVVSCLTHPNTDVRRYAIISLKEIYNEDTSSKLIKQYYEEVLQNKLAILEVLQVIGTDDDVPFLLEQFEQENDMIKLVAGRAIASIVNGLEILESSSLISMYPWSVIVRQIRGERAA